MVLMIFGLIRREESILLTRFTKEIIVNERKKR